MAALLASDGLAPSATYAHRDWSMLDMGPVSTDASLSGFLLFGFRYYPIEML